MRESFQLDENKILNADEKIKQALIKFVIDKFKLLATHPSQYGETKVLQMKIDLVPGAIPYKSRVRPLNLDQKDNLRKQIDKWLEQGVIEPSVSPCVSRLVPVKKNDGRTRWVTDLGEFNKKTCKDSNPLTNIQEILHSWYISIHKDAVWVSQLGECVQQDVECGYEGGGQGLLDVLP